MSNPGPATTTGTPLQNLSSNQAIRLLAIKLAVNMGATGDTELLTIDTVNYSVSNVVVTNATASLAQAVGGVYTAPSGGGTMIVGSAALSALSASTKVAQMTVASTDRQTGLKLYFRVATANTAAATADVAIYGYDFSGSST